MDEWKGMIVSSVKEEYSIESSSIEDCRKEWKKRFRREFELALSRDYFKK